MGDYTSIIVHGIVFIFGIFGIGVSVVLVNTLLFIGSIITLFGVGYSFYEILMKIRNSSQLQS